MKMNNEIVELMLDLNAIEGVENSHLLIGEGRYLRNNLLKLYRSTENPRSHELIADIMTAAGYQWFAKLVNVSNVQNDSTAMQVQTVAKSHQTSQSLSSDHCLMSDDEFMELIPANGLFH